MNEFLAAFRELLAVQTEVRGEEVTVTIRGEAIPALVEDMSFEEVEIVGGNAEAGGYRAIIAQEDISGYPIQNEEIKRGAHTLQILSFTARNKATFELIAGDPVQD